MFKLLYVVNNPDFFVSHRLEIARKAVSEGYQVSLACPKGNGIDDIERAGVRVFDIPVDRANHGWLAQFRFMKAVLGICKAVKPDICHLITLKTFLVGGFAAKLAGVPFRIGSVSGLGFLFISQSIKTKIFRVILRPLFKWVMVGEKTKVIFQNDTDKNLMIGYVGLKETSIHMIRGSGVDLEQFPYIPEPDSSSSFTTAEGSDEGCKVVMASRLLRDKGVVEYLEAARYLKEQGTQATFYLAGDPDPVNPASITSNELNKYIEMDGVHWLGQVDDIARLFSESNLVVLPSYREGFPKVLIEAAACGRSIVTTDVPGCRDAIEEGVTGLLVPARSASLLAEAILELCEDSDKRSRFGQQGRKRAEQLFSVFNVVEQHMQAYKSFL